MFAAKLFVNNHRRVYDKVNALQIYLKPHFKGNLAGMFLYKIYLFFYLDQKIKISSMRKCLNNALRIPLISALLKIIFVKMINVMSFNEPNIKELLI